jgi:hypothetical protein
MNGASPSALPLRDIHLPAPVSWWPPATGWWLVLALGVLVLAAVALHRWWRRRTRLRRLALAELAVIEQAYARSGDGHACARGLSQLLRRLALVGAGRDAAAATGDAWLAQVGAMHGAPLPAELRPVLLLAPYAPGPAQALAAEDFAAAGAVLRRCIAQVTAARRRAPAS